MGTLIPQSSVRNLLKNYYELTKPKIWYLLVFTAFGAALTASFLFDIPISPLTWALLIGGVAAGSAAADTLTGYNDRDIDAIMDRTKDRPIPSGRIKPKSARVFVDTYPHLEPCAARQEGLYPRQGADAARGVHRAVVRPGDSRYHDNDG